MTRSPKESEKEAACERMQWWHIVTYVICFLIILGSKCRYVLVTDAFFFSVPLKDQILIEKPYFHEIWYEYF
jgi:hypothetical protein